MGDLIDLNAPRALTVADLPSGAALDTETVAAINAHVAATDPHPVYLTQPEGDTRYEYRAGLASKSIPGSLSYPANIWTSLGTFPGFPIGVQGAPSAILVAAAFTFDTSAPWQQACCSAILGPVWWQPINAGDPGTTVWLEFHNQTGFFVRFRFGGFSQDVRPLQFLPETSISIPSTGRVDVTLKRLI